MIINTNLIAEVITIILGIIAFYNVVTKPMKECIDSLSKKIEDMTMEYFNVRIKVEKIDQSVKSAHKRINGISN